VVTAHKGKIGMNVLCKGLEAHSALAPLAVNAVYMALDLIAEIRGLQKEIAATGAPTRRRVPRWTPDRTVCPSSIDAPLRVVAWSPVP
jgi:acetylornithine deacetylase/succinyl-diaminopimelate desuccinylase-like protein